MYGYSDGMTIRQEKEFTQKKIIGNVEQMQSKRDAEKSIVALRSSINVDTGIPRTIADLDAQYRKYELTQDKKSFSTIESHRLLYKRYIEPRWASCDFMQFERLKLRDGFILWRWHLLQKQK
jgi:hypothetical protein